MLLKDFFKQEEKGFSYIATVYVKVCGNKNTFLEMFDFSSQIDDGHNEKNCQSTQDHTHHLW